YYNPGAIGLSRGFNFMVDGILAWRTATYERSEICAPGGATPTPCGYGPNNNEYAEPSDGIGANNSKSTLKNVVAAPMLGATGRVPVSEDVALGFGAGFFVPFGGQSSWNGNSAFDGSRYTGAQDGAARWWAIDGTLRSLFVSAAFSVSISELVHLGISGGIAINQVDTIRAKTLDGSNNLLAEGRALLQGKSIDPQLGGGVVVTPFKNNDLRLGVSYQAPVGITGVAMGGTLTLHDGRGQVTEQDVDFHTVWPDTFRFGVAYKPIEELELRLNANVQRWSLLKDQCITNAGAPCDIEEDGSEPLADPNNPDGPEKDDNIVNIPRRWNDSFGIRVGATYNIIPEVGIFGGVGYDSNAVPDATLEPALTDFHDVAVNIGGQFQFTENIGLAASYTQIFYISRDNTGKGELQNFAPDSLGPDAAGKFTQAIGFLNINVIGSFDPWAEEAPEPQAASSR
ncbi:MAG: outer membrane protein transport protein, partial [Myxococcales bacterium]|nr:outer membrane protein transport protein [Myxococcales bacterium]